MRTRNLVICLLVLSVMGLLGCSTLPALLATSTPLPSPTPSVTPSQTPLPPTATATVTPTRTPRPTINYGATSTAETATAVAKDATWVQNELRQLNLPISTDGGSLGWLSDSAKNLMEEKSGYFRYDFPDQDQVFDDFIFKADVDWTTTSSKGGCGFIYHASDSNLDNASFYIFLPVDRIGSPSWDIFFIRPDGYWDDLMGQSQINQKIKTGQGVSNTFVLVVQQNLATAYVNGLKLGSAISGDRKSGYAGYLVNQDAPGRTTCTFNDAWTWKLP